MYKKITILLFSILLYQSSSFSKSTSFGEFDARNLSNYFSGIVAFENRNNSEALNFFNSSKILINKHDSFLERFTMSLVLEGKVNQAVNFIKMNENQINSNFFEAYVLLALDSVKKKNLKKANKILLDVPEFLQKDRFRFIILSSLKKHINVFSSGKIIRDGQNFGSLSLITETFLRCYLDDDQTSSFFSRLINNVKADYSRYTYFYLTYLIENKLIEEAKETVDDLDYINTTLLLSQGKSWIENNKYEEFKNVFSCGNQNDVIGEFLFLISNLYSSQDRFDISNFYLSLSNYMNPKFVFNLSLVAENSYLNGNYEKSKKVLKNFDKHQDLYYWYRSKKEAQIIVKTKNRDEGLNYITSKFLEIENPNNKFLFDIANFNKNSKKFDQAIKYYSMIINSLENKSSLKADLLYRRGGTFERMKDYSSADRDLLHSLEINPDDAYVLNYLAYSWLERDYKINEAIQMLEKAYTQENDDPYIIDSIGWAYYLIDDFIKAEKFLKRAVELMPDDPIVNDHYGDILWKLNRKIQARYFWSMVLKMEDVEPKLIEQIKEKLIYGPTSS
ncbi:tetratricopeptide repeat protein [Candidatus Pelagibacter communis]|uniref:tetratricopeptide repeat protein n=1 Tax=Pelagibacter ubique TaxID=198252 RepID=UPI00094D9043|nr:tetratricopeptide repeat protein [Candidatus Pelagibacter ubique]|tara:strand:- start:917 stop:2599 length:1683 start_codon:yes stop_codon:yes gene_type:complete